MLDRGRNKHDKQRIDKIVGNNIRRQREFRRMSRDELAEVLDLTVSHLGLIERGERGATSVTLEKLVKIFNVTIDSLYAIPTRSGTREKRDERTPSRMKVDALISYLTDQELDALTYSVKGILSMRKSGNPEIEELIED